MYGMHINKYENFLPMYVIFISITSTAIRYFIKNFIIRYMSTKDDNTTDVNYLNNKFKLFSPIFIIINIITYTLIFIIVQN